MKTARTKLDKEKEACESVTETFDVVCDLMSFKSVEAAAEEVNKICGERGGLNVLANNAGISDKDMRTEDGFDTTMQVNHLSQYLLTKLTFPALQQAYDAGQEVRICQHSSTGRNLFHGILQPKYFKKSAPGTLGGNSFFAGFFRYHQTKLANSCFVLRLYEELKAQGYDTEHFKSVAAEPGAASTEFVDKSADIVGRFEYFMLVWATRIALTLFGYQSAADGSLCLVEACFGNEVKSGDFFMPQHGFYGNPLRVIGEGKLTKNARSKERPTLKESNQKVVWEASIDACGKLFA